MKAYLRKDLLEEELSPPCESGYLEGVDWNQSFECIQPVYLENDEFSLGIFLPRIGLVWMNSIDFDFLTEKGD